MTTATAKRFSSTIEYTDQCMTIFMRSHGVGLLQCFQAPVKFFQISCFLIHWSVWMLHLRRVSYRQCIDRTTNSFSASIEDVCMIIKVRWQPRKNLATNHDWNAV